MSGTTTPIRVGDQAAWTTVTGTPIPVRIEHVHHSGGIVYGELPAPPWPGDKWVTVSVRATGHGHHFDEELTITPIWLAPVDHAERAAGLRCRDCAEDRHPDQPLTYQGHFGFKGETTFARYQCPRCQTSWPEGSMTIVRQLCSPEGN